MWIIANIEFLTGKGQDFGQTWTLGHLDHCAKGIVQWWVAICIKKLQKEHLVMASTLALKTIYTLFKPLVQKIMNAMHTARYLRALASCCAFPLTILRLARLDHCVKGIVQWWVALGIKNLHKEHLVMAQTLALKTIYTLFKPLVQNIWMLCILCALASCCAFPLTILHLAHLDHCKKGIVQWRVAISIKSLH